ncbi:MAG TPA: hypothetical protein VLB90_00070 [Pseudomonadales bacterium]|nr:hypothetical protein [Pseudomonadales bacterium]
MQKKWDRHEIIQLLSLSGTLAGLSITGLTIFRTENKSYWSVTITDDVLAISALLFLVATYLFFFSLRSQKEKTATILEKMADFFFLLALTGMVSSGFIMVYTIW